MEPTTTTATFDFWNLLTASPWLGIGWVLWRYLPTLKGFYDSYRESVVIHEQTKDALIRVADEMEENRKFMKALVKAYKEAGHELTIPVEG